MSGRGLAAGAQGKSTMPSITTRRAPAPLSTGVKPAVGASKSPSSPGSKAATALERKISNELPAPERRRSGEAQYNPSSENKPKAPPAKSPPARAGVGTSALPNRIGLRRSPDPAPRNAATTKRPPAQPGSGPGIKMEVAAKVQLPSNRKPAEARNGLKFRALARSVFALLSLNREMWTKRKSKFQEALDNYRTDEGQIRMLDLPWCPLTNHADQVARDEMVEVVCGLYQSNWRAAEDEAKMKSRRITHVLSTLEEEENPSPNSFTYLNLVFDDDEEEDPSIHFHAAASFIRDAIEAGGCLVHCAAGVSRSSSLTLAYLIREKRMTLKEALRALRERRPICWPNAGFMGKLIRFEESIFGGRASIRVDEYERWTEANAEAVQMAKVVDRDRVGSVRSLLGSGTTPRQGREGPGQEGGLGVRAGAESVVPPEAMKGRTPIVEDDDDGFVMHAPPSRARA